MGRKRNRWYHDQQLLVRVQALKNQGADSYRLVAFLAENGHPGIHPNSLRCRLSEVSRGIQRPADRPGPDVEERVDFLENREERLSLRGMRTAEARWQRVIGMVGDKIAAMPVPNVPTMLKPHYKPSRTVVALLSDMHTYQIHPKEEMGERLAYTDADLEDRFGRWQSETCRFISEQRDIGNLEHIALFGLGDYVENAQMRSIQAFNSSHTTVESAIHAADLITKAVSLWESLYDCTISVDLLAGNHDRVGAKGDYRHYESWAMVISALVAARFAGHSRIKVEFHTTQYALIALGRWKFLLDHGDHVAGSNRQNGMERRAQLWKGVHRQTVDFICTAHVHSPASWIDPYGTRIVVNGSFADTSPYALSEFAGVSPGTQKIMALDRQLGLVSERDILLRPSKLDPTPIQQRIGAA